MNIEKIYYVEILPAEWGGGVGASTLIFEKNVENDKIFLHYVPQYHLRKFQTFYVTKHKY